MYAEGVAFPETGSRAVATSRMAGATTSTCGRSPASSASIRPYATLSLKNWWMPASSSRTMLMSISPVLSYTSPLMM